MKLRYACPRQDLRPFIRAYYLFETPAGGDQPLCAELGNIRIFLKGSGRIALAGGLRLDAPRFNVLGPTMSAYRADCAPGSVIFGVGVRPLGWDALFGFGAHEGADRILDFEAAAAGPVREGLERLQEARDLRGMVAAADGMIAGLIARRSRRAARFPVGLEGWIASPDDLSLNRLLEMSGYSARQTDRLARRYFGAGPKRLQRKYRALRAADRIRRDLRDWRDAAGPAFYDQAHFIKEFKSFVGVTPGAFLAHEAALIERVRSERHLASARIPLAAL